ARAQEAPRAAAAPRPGRGYRKLYVDHVNQAEHGCDFDFLRSETDRGAVPGAPAVPGAGGGGAHV
ncbi:dihydroxy-acid dehydratase, partial [Nocardiopsis tropica]|nr:dihydroxy-acid dehydratase [Nocardiopsis tropica]